MNQDTSGKLAVNPKGYSSTSSYKSPNSVASNTKKSLNGSYMSPFKASAKGKANGGNDLASMQKVIRDQENELNQLRCAFRSESNYEKIVDDLTKENEEVRRRLKESEFKREELQDQIVASTNIQQDVKNKIERFNTTVVKENEDIKKAMVSKEKEIREKDSRIDFLRSIIQQGELEKQEMKLKLEQNQNNTEDNKANIYESEQMRIKLQREYERSLSEYNSKLSQEYEKEEELMREIEELKDTIRQFEKEQGQFQLERQKMNRLLKEEQDKNKKMNELQKILTDVQNERDLLMRQLEDYYKDQVASKKKIEDLREETENLLQKVKDDIKQLEDAKRQLEKELFEKDEELAKKDVIIKNLTQKQLDLGEAMNKFQRFLDAHNDLKKQMDDIKNENEMLREAKGKAHQDLMESNKLLDLAAMGSDEFQQKIKDLMDRMREQDEEIEAMKLYVQQMRAKYQIYVPDREDPVDSQLAEYINNYPERSKMRIMFLKESEGVYHFGSKRVYVRCERDRITVRVGGGYLSLDEFLDIYTPMELEKVERNDPIKKFSEKVAIQKTLSYHSPVRSPRTGAPQSDSQKKREGSNQAEGVRRIDSGDEEKVQGTPRDKKKVEKKTL